LFASNCVHLCKESKVIGTPSDQKGPGMPGGPLYYVKSEILKEL